MLKKADYNAKITKIEYKMPSISDLATNSALTAVENKIPVSSLVKKADYNTKITEMEKKVLIIIMTNILLLQSLISFWWKTCTSKLSNKNRFWH